MAAGDILQGNFDLAVGAGRATITSFIGGTTYFALTIKAHGYVLIGNNTIDPAGAATAKGYRMSPGEVLTLDNDGATAGIIDGAKINVMNAQDKIANIEIFAVANV
jgi:hypothetical protein